MSIVRRSAQASFRKGIPGFTLTEVVISIGLTALTFTGVIYGYALTSDQAQWSACSLAAHSIAVQGIEQARAAKWDPMAWPPIDELGTTNYSLVSPLDVPVAKGNTMYATNYISVSTVSTYPPVRELRADCVWKMLNGSRTRGLFTNSVFTLRAPDQ
jgi:type II secretory pathway pseudopilin PulG